VVLVTGGAGHWRGNAKADSERTYVSSSSQTTNGHCR